MSVSSKISILQHNTARTPIIMHSCLEIAIKSCIDFVLIQEPWIAFDNNAAIIISHSAYYCILPNSYNNIRSRVTIYARKQSNYQFCHRIDLTNDTDIIIINDRMRRLAELKTRGTRYGYIHEST